MKLLRVNKDQYTKQRGHRKIFTGREGVSFLSFFFLHELPSSEKYPGVPIFREAGSAIVRCYSFYCPVFFSLQ